MSVHTDALCVHGFVRLEVVECPARAPRPCRQHAPVIDLPRLAFVDEADDAARQALTVVGLHRTRIHRRIPPAEREGLLLVGRALRGRRPGGSASAGAAHRSGAGGARLATSCRTRRQAELHARRPGRGRRVRRTAHRRRRRRGWCVRRHPRGLAPAPKPPAANDKTTGTGPNALAGVLSDARMLTVKVGYEELSTRPMSFLVITGMSPFISRVVLNTSHVTLGVTFGVRPYTSRSNISRSSARRWLFHIAADVTRRPSFIRSGSGNFGYGLARASL